MDSDTEKYQAAFTGLAKARRRVVTAVAMIPIATTLLVLAFLKIPALSVIGLVLALYGVFAWDAAHNRLTAVLCPRCDAPFVADNAHARELLLGARKCSHCQLSFGAAPEKTGYRHAHRPAPTLDSVAESAMQERWGGLRSWWYRPALLLAAHATLWVGIALWDSAALFALAPLLFVLVMATYAIHARRRGYPECPSCGGAYAGRFAILLGATCDQCEVEFGTVAPPKRQRLAPPEVRVSDDEQDELETDNNDATNQDEGKTRRGPGRNRR